MKFFIVALCAVSLAQTQAIKSFVVTNNDAQFNDLVAGFNSAIVENTPAAIAADAEVSAAVQARLNTLLPSLEAALAQFKASSAGFPYKKISDAQKRDLFKNSNDVTISNLENAILFIKNGAITFYDKPNSAEKYVQKYYDVAQGLINLFENAFNLAPECAAVQYPLISDPVAAFAKYFQQTPASNDASLAYVARGFPELTSTVSTAVTFTYTQNTKVKTCYKNVDSCVNTFLATPIDYAPIKALTTVSKRYAVLTNIEYLATINVFVNNYLLVVNTRDLYLCAPNEEY